MPATGRACWPAARGPRPPRPMRGPRPACPLSVFPSLVPPCHFDTTLTAAVPLPVRSRRSLRLGGAAGQRLSQRLHSPPRASGEFEMEAGIVVGKIVSGDLPNAPKPVFQSAAVDNQGLGGLLMAATALQVDRYRFDVTRTAARVVPEQWVQPVGGQLPQVRGVRDLAEQPEHSEIIEA